MLSDYISAGDYEAVCLRHSFINLISAGDYSIVGELRKISAADLNRTSRVRLALLAADIEYHFGSELTTDLKAKLALSEPYFHELAGDMIVFYACPACVNYQVFVEENYFSQV